MDQDNIIKIYARTDNRIQLKMIPGHFVTSQSHITHYLDLTTMKSRCAEAQRIASALAANYEASIPVDTIVCMDGLEVIGAYLAEELTKAGVLSKMCIRDRPFTGSMIMTGFPCFLATS